MGHLHMGLFILYLIVTFIILTTADLPVTEVSYFHAMIGCALSCFNDLTAHIFERLLISDVLSWILVAKILPQKKI